jgi:hypothetical protein
MWMRVPRIPLRFILGYFRPLLRSGGQRAKPAPNAGFRDAMAQKQAKIGVNPIKTEENCGKAAFSH